MTVRRPKKSSLTVGFTIRPHYKEMIKKLQPLYNLVILTSSAECYAEAIFKVLDPGNTIFLKLLAKPSCVTYGSKSVKDLRIFEGVPMEELILIDNFAYAYSAQQDNGVPILPFFSQPEDEELVGLTNFLEWLATQEDTQTALRDQFFNHLINECKDVQDYVLAIKGYLEANP